LALEAFFYPFYYHAILQRLGLVPAHPYLPPLSTLNPLSKLSPLTPLSIYYDPFASLIDFVKAVVTSPLMVLCGEHLFERWVYDMINEAVDASVICPDNPDIVSPGANDKHRIMKALGLRRQSPPLVRGAIERFMVTLGWGTSSNTNEAESPHPAETALPLPPQEGQTIDVNGTTVTDVTPLELPNAQIPSLDATDRLEIDPLAMSVVAIDEVNRPATPLTPLALEPQYEDDDPRIRITSREGIVEMEVRLPPHILSTHTEVADVLGSSQTQQDGALGQRNRPHHRVTHLSLEASDKISVILKTHLVGFAVLPFKLVALRLVASHYLHGGGAESSRVAVPLPRFSELSWRSIGVQVSRLALCQALQLAIDLGIWSVQYAASLNIGLALFGWGNL
jgi:hypothetical protein